METENVNNLTPEQEKRFRLEAERIYKEDEKGFQKTMNLMTKLGIGGLWKGFDATLVILYKETINKGNKSNDKKR